MLYFIGLGLHDTGDIPLKGLEALKKCTEAYAEFYTNRYAGDIDELGRLAGKKINVLRRADLEERPEENVLKNSKASDVALLVPGDPMVATTHVDLIMRARKLGVETRIIHASSVYSAVGETGLQIYKFGKTSSLPYPEKSYFPTTPYDVLKDNLGLGLHTLFLLDIKADVDRYMTVGEGISLLLEMEEQKNQNVFTPDTLCVGVARLGGECKIKAARAKDLLQEDFGGPPHCLIIPGKLHYLEREALEAFN
ncbi:MAG: diphthine synthase [Candidatus Altiarchaeota archaeon]|nr:diphthine synthase [Candidatus Altiarchaeota archaeon]